MRARISTSGVGRQRHAAAVGQHERHRQVAPAVAVGDDLLQRLRPSSRRASHGRSAPVVRRHVQRRPATPVSSRSLHGRRLARTAAARFDSAAGAATIATFARPGRRRAHPDPMSAPAPRRAPRRAFTERAVPRRARAVRDRRHDHLRARAGDGRFVGFTANSFNSVSLDPPLVVWSLDRALDEPRRVRDGRALRDQRARARPGRARAPLFAAARRPLRGRRLTGWAAAGAPLIEGCVAWFECRHHARHRAGDHVLFIGEVETCARRNGRGARVPPRPLRRRRAAAE